MQITIDLTALTTDVGLKAGRCAAVALLSALPQDEAEAAIDEWHAVLQVRLVEPRTDNPDFERGGKGWDVPLRHFDDGEPAVHREATAFLQPETASADEHFAEPIRIGIDAYVLTPPNGKVGKVIAERIEDGDCQVIVEFPGGIKLPYAIEDVQVVADQPAPAPAPKATFATTTPDENGEPSVTYRGKTYKRLGSARTAALKDLADKPSHSTIEGAWDLVRQLDPYNRAFAEELRARLWELQGIGPLPAKPAAAVKQEAQVEQEGQVEQVEERVGPPTARPASTPLSVVKPANGEAKDELSAMDLRQLCRHVGAQVGEERVFEAIGKRKLASIPEAEQAAVRAAVMGLLG